MPSNVWRCSETRGIRGRATVAADTKASKGSKEGKIKKVGLAALQTGLKQGLADADKARQKETRMVLQIVLIIEARAADLSPEARRGSTWSTRSWAGSPSGRRLASWIVCLWFIYQLIIK